MVGLGPYISAIGHMVVLGWVFVVSDLPSKQPPAAPLEVSVISPEQFAIIANNTPPDIGATDVAQPQTPAAPQVPTLSSTAVQGDTAPTVTLPVGPQAVSKDAVPKAIPTAVPTPKEVAFLAPPPPNTPEISDETSRPRVAPRVAPRSAPPPPSGVDISDINRDGPGNTPSDTPPEADKATAQAEATTRTVTEAEEKLEQESAAPARSRPPKGRPTDLASAAPAPAANGVIQDALNAALAAALAESAAATGSVAPQTENGVLTTAEALGLQQAIQMCWNVGSLSSAAMSTTVTIGFEMDQDARPLPSSLRLVTFTGGSDAGARQAYEAGRRAILRCGAQGFDLPPEKFDAWRAVEMTFNPDQMRLR